MLPAHESLDYPSKIQQNIKKRLFDSLKKKKKIRKR